MSQFHIHKEQYGIPFFWIEVKSFKNADFYKGENQLFWETFIFSFAIEEIIGYLPTLYIPLINGDIFRIYSFVKVGFHNYFIYFYNIIR